MPILFHPLIFIYTSRVQKLTRSLRFSLRLFLGVLVVAFAADRGVLDWYMSDNPTNQELDASTECSLWGDRRNSATSRVVHSNSAKAFSFLSN